MNSSSLRRVAGRLKHSFRANVLSLVVLAAVLPTLALSLINWLELRNQIQSSHRDLLATLAQETARGVKTWVDEQEAVARAFGRTGELNQNWTSLSAHRSAGSATSDEYFLDLFRLHRVIEECNQSSPWITEVGLSTRDGKVVISDNSELPRGVDAIENSGALPASLEGVVQQGATLHSNVYLAPRPSPMGMTAPQLETGFPTMQIYAPIQADGNRVEGILSCRLAITDLGPVQFPTEAYSQPLFIYLTTPDGAVVSSNRQREWKPEKIVIPPQREGQSWPNAGDTMDGFVSRTGTQVVAAWARVPTLNLVVLCEVPARTLLEPQRTALGTMLALCLVLCGLSVLLTLRRADHLLAPLRVLQNAAVRLALGDRSVRTQLEGDDELGQLSRTFDHMAATLETTMSDMVQARDEALSANRAKSRFLANMTHELRTPLNAVIGYSEMITAEAKDGPVASEQLVEDLEVIRSSGQHLLELINEILDLSKIEAGKMDLHPEEFELSELLKEVCTIVVPLVANGGNKLERVEEGVPGIVLLDRMKLKQMLLNLLSNACKFTKDGTIWLRSIDERDSIRIEVRDTGIGMSETQQARIFVEFGQAEDGTSRKYGGTGLGLTIVRRLATLMGGVITVTSESGKGSTFALSLPRRAEAPPQEG